MSFFFYLKANYIINKILINTNNCEKLQDHSIISENIIKVYYMTKILNKLDNNISSW